MKPIEAWSVVSGRGSLYDVFTDEKEFRVIPVMIMEIKKKII